MPVELLGQSADELRALLAAWGEPAYRGAQIYHALYAEHRYAFAVMTNLPAALRQQLAREASITLQHILRRYRSADGSVSYVLLLRPSEGAGLAPHRGASTVIETVFMPEERRQTICLSTQAGCAVDCAFCLTATLGLIRNLTA